MELISIFFVDMGTRVIDTLLIPIKHFVSAGERFYWLYFLSSLAIALLFYAYQMSREGQAFKDPLTLERIRSIIFHRSAKVDYMYFFINRIFMVVIIIPLMLKLGAVQIFVSDTLASLVDFTPITLPYPLLASIFFTFIAVLVADFFIFFAHYLLHRVSYLWEFHKVHHSAEVLTPMTEYRMHPIDDILALGMGACANGILYGLLIFLFGSSIELITVANLNIFMFLFYFFGFHLRHSPVFISYGKFWERIFISPAAHQVHHSNKREHYDRNFGFIFSFWDQMFGSLIFPERGMQISYGIGGEEKEMQSVRALYFRPFRKCFELIRGKQPVV